MFQGGKNCKNKYKIYSLYFQLPWELPPSYSLTNICLLCSPHILTNTFFSQFDIKLCFVIIWFVLNISLPISEFKHFSFLVLYSEWERFIPWILYCHSQFDFSIELLNFLAHLQKLLYNRFYMIFSFLTLQIYFLMLHLCSCYVKYPWNRQLQTD